VDFKKTPHTTASVKQQARPPKESEIYVRVKEHTSLGMRDSIASNALRLLTSSAPNCTQEKPVMS
jgi:hypothetical protein